jgi:hypothetical protein
VALCNLCKTLVVMVKDYAKFTLLPMKLMVFQTVLLLFFVLLMPSAQATQLAGELDPLVATSSSIVSENSEEATVVEKVLQEKVVEEGEKEAVELASSTASFMQPDNLSSSTLTGEEEKMPEEETSVLQLLSTLEATSAVITEITTNTTLPAGVYEYDTLLIKTGATLTLAGDRSIGVTQRGVKIIANQIIVEPNARISADRQGFGAIELQAGNFTTAQTGSVRYPRDLGSSNYGNFRGGGAIELQVAELLMVDGEITAHGDSLASGGSILINTPAISGTGLISAGGGNFAFIGASLEGPGIGGNIAIYTDANTFAGSVTAPGGRLYTVGFSSRFTVSGSVAFFNRAGTRLSTDQRWRFQANDAPHMYESVHLSGGNSVVEPGVELVVSDMQVSSTTVLEFLSGHTTSIDTLQVSDTATIVFGEGIVAPIRSIELTDSAKITSTPLNRLILPVQDMYIGPNATISLNELGYGPGEGPGSPDPVDSATGASHGGRGLGPNAKPPYGNPIAPVDFGSGSYVYRGGGALQLLVSGTLDLAGSITATGGATGSGGSLWLRVGTLQGSGLIAANGGNFGGSASFIGPGGGGRVAVYFEQAGNWTGTTTATGGRRQSSGGSFTIVYAESGSVVFEQVASCNENCNSSVLFLPGIQASRLYKTGLLGFEDQLWEPTTNQDVRQLALTEDGLSVNEIYTRDVVDEVVLPVLGPNIYKGFIGMMNQMVSEGLISAWQPFAYDWRFAVNDIVVSGTRYENEVRSLIDAVENLADSSNTGAVSIVAHSNGGLLAKSLVAELERIGRADLIDSIIFIGTPHLGTPKAIGTVLHGYDQQKLGGLLIDDKDAREVINNMPGAYALLPSEAYLAKAVQPVITIDNSEATAALYAQYGESIDSITEYVDFLNGAEGRSNNYDNISVPYTTNTGMLNNALESHRNQLDNWQPPANVSVYNIVGVGLKTINAVKYREVVESASCSSNFFGRITCEAPERLLRPYANFTQYGDETVTSLSAESVEGNTFYFDMLSFNNDQINPLSSISHDNFVEIGEVLDFVSNIVTDRVSSIKYLSTTASDFTQSYIIKSIDSPVSILVTDSLGNQTGVIDGDIYQNIPDSQYFEFGGTKYLIIPKDIDIQVQLKGEAYGGYTLTIATLESSGEQTIDSVLVNATTTPNMTAEYSSH